MDLRNEHPGDLAGSEADTAALSDAKLNMEAERRVVDVLRVLWRSRKAMLSSMVFGGLIGVVVAFLLPVRYQSTARLMPPDNMPSVGSTMLATLGGAAGAASDLLGMKTNGALFTVILGSDSVLDPLINRFDLRKVYHCRTYYTARKKLASKTAVAEDRKSGVVTISVVDSDPNRAAQMAGAYIDELNRVVVGQSTSSARRERIFLEQRLDEVKKDLDASQKALSEFSSKNVTFDPREQGEAMLDAGGRLQAELIAAQAELDGLNKIYAPDNARVLQVQARVSSFRAALGKFSGAAGPGSAQSSDSLYPSLRNLPLLGNTYVELTREAKIDEVVYEDLTKQYEFAKVQEAKEIPTVKVLDPPLVPEVRSFPPRGMVVVLGAILGVLGSTLSVLLNRKRAATAPVSHFSVFVSEVMGDIRGLRKK